VTAPGRRTSRTGRLTRSVLLATGLATGLALRMAPIGMLSLGAGMALAQTPAQSVDWERLDQAFETYVMAGKIGEATDMGRRLVDLSAKTLPPFHPRQAVSLWKLGQLYLDTRQPRLAEPLLRRALAITEHLSAPPAGALASLLASLARLCAGDGRTDEAERLYARATALLTPPTEKDMPLLAQLQYGQGVMYAVLDQPVRAEPLLQKSLATREALAGPQGSFEVAHTLRVLGISRRAARDYEGAVAYLERALEVGERQKPPSDALIALTLDELAATWVARGQPARGEAAARRAILILNAPTSSNNAELARGLYTLGQILNATGDLDGAEAAANRSLELRQLLYWRNDPAIAETLELLSGIEARRGRVERAATLRARMQQVNDAIAQERQDPVDKAPGYASAPQVTYPEAARRGGYEGKVVLRALVGTEGIAATTTVVESSGYAVLDEAATEAVFRMKFSPAQTRSGRAVMAPIQVPVDFRLGPAAAAAGG
jgi:TonB family protein